MSDSKTSDIQSVAQEIDEEGSALVRHDIAEQMITSGDFERREGEGQATGFIPLKRAQTS
jgi:hypothetical protein